jgi:hypothetical protein
MEPKRVHRQVERTPEEISKLAELRARFQSERPSLQELLGSGDTTEVVLHGVRAKMQELGIAPQDVAEAVQWARK